MLNLWLDEFLERQEDRAAADWRVSIIKKAVKSDVLGTAINAVNDRRERSEESEQDEWDARVMTISWGDGDNNSPAYCVVLNETGEVMQWVKLERLRGPAELRGPDTETIAAACDTLLREISPIDDIRSTADYRLQVSKNLLTDFLYALQAYR